MGLCGLPLKTLRGLNPSDPNWHHRHSSPLIDLDGLARRLVSHRRFVAQPKLPACFFIWLTETMTFFSGSRTLNATFPMVPDWNQHSGVTCPSTLQLCSEAEVYEEGPSVQGAILVESRMQSLEMAETALPASTVAKTHVHTSLPCTANTSCSQL